MNNKQRYTLKSIFTNCHEADVAFGLGCLAKLTILAKLEIRLCVAEYFI